MIAGRNPLPLLILIAASKAEWGIVLGGSILISTVDEHGRRQVEDLDFGDIWYFPKGTAHTLQGLDDENELLLVFDQPNFDDTGYVRGSPAGLFRISALTSLR